MQNLSVYDKFELSLYTNSTKPFFDLLSHTTIKTVSEISNQCFLYRFLGMKETACTSLLNREFRLTKYRLNSRLKLLKVPLIFGDTSVRVV